MLSSLPVTLALQAALLAAPAAPVDLSAKLAELPVASAAGAMSPRLSQNGDEIILSWLEPIEGAPAELKDDAFELKWGRLSASSGWSRPLSAAKSLRMFANTADMPSVFPAKGIFFAHWLEKINEQPYAYDALIAQSRDGGRTWRHLGSLRRDSGRKENNYDGFLSFLPEGGSARAFWIDGRNDRGEEDNYQLRTAKIATSLREEAVLDGSTCSCCDIGSALTDKGPVVVYRGRRDGDIRDIHIVARKGSGWSQPRPVHTDGWQIAGCPVNGPQAAASGPLLAVAWFSGAGGRDSVKLAFSRDSGQTFAPPLELDDLSPGGPIGRVDVALAGGEAFVSWLGRADESGQGVLFLRRVSPSGLASPIVRMMPIDAGWRSGFPQLVARKDELLLAWTGLPDKEDAPTLGVRTARLALRDIPPATGIPPSTTPSAALSADEIMKTSFKDLAGKETRFSDLGGKLLLVSLWATWCEPCHKEQAELAELHRLYSAKGLSIIGINLDLRRHRAKVESFVKERSLPYAVWLDPKSKALSLFATNGVPSTFLMNPKGEILFRKTGFLRLIGSELEKTIARSLSAAPRP